MKLEIPTTIILGTCGHCGYPVTRDLRDDEWEPPKCTHCKRPTKGDYGPVLEMGELEEEKSSER